jgi:hypothetical protein
LLDATLIDGAGAGWANGELALLEFLEEQLSAEVSVSLLAEVERELLRLRSESSGLYWKRFCSEFPKRRLFETLRMGTLTLKRLDQSSASCPADVLDLVMADSFPARPYAVPSPAHVMNAWEYSLPVSRSVRARKVYFAREIAEAIRTAIKPRILILGGGRLREADDAIRSAHLHNAEFIAVQKGGVFDAERVLLDLPNDASSCPLRIENGSWPDLGQLSAQLGEFDLIYSPAWLDSSDDIQAVNWLAAGVEMLRTSGRLLAANFAPGSRDAGWVEACWNWHPHYRSEEQLAQLVMELKSPSIRGHAVFRDESGASAFLEIHAL